jgi:hypothetical protein
MALKFNKEMLLKHRFWIMLGVSVTLILTGIIILELSEAEGKNLLEKALKSTSATPVTDGAKTVKTYKEYAEIARKNVTEVWRIAYEPQAKLFAWSKPMEDQFDFANGYFANEIKISKDAKLAKIADAKKWKEATKSWPADNPFLMHGAYERQGDDWFEMTDRNGELKKFFLTRRSEKITTDDGKQVGFAKLDEVAPKKMLAVGYQRGKYFGDPLTQNEMRTFKTHYLDQVATLIKSVDPLDNKLNGVVQLKGWLYQSDGAQKDTLPHETVEYYPFVRYVKADWPAKDFSKMAWIAQEDLWIQTEIYRMIKAANDSVSDFTPQFKGKSDERNKAYAFQNSYFDLELKLDKNDALSFKIKNRLPRKQSIDLKFRVRLNGAKGHKEELIEISGFPLMPAGTKGTGANDGDYLVQSFPKGKDERTGIYSVQQVLSWQTAAVKRIDQISIGSNDQYDISHSQRTIAFGLQPFDPKDVVADDGKPAVVVPTKGKGRDKKGPFGGPGTKDSGKKQSIPMGAGNRGQDEFKLGLWTYRYVEVTEQARRVPVAVVLIVDQGHVDRVLTSFNNSKLRFLDTQVLLNQYPSSLQPPVIEAEKTDAAPARPMFFGPGSKGAPPPPKTPEPSGSGELETNMELVIYGIVTLYQRYPPRPALPPL